MLNEGRPGCLSGVALLSFIRCPGSVHQRCSPKQPQGFTTMSRPLLLATAAIVLAWVGAAGAAAPPARGIDGPRRERLNEVAGRLNAAATAGKLDLAERLSAEQLALLSRWLGDKHRQTMKAQRNLQGWRSLVKVDRADWPKLGRAFKAAQAANAAMSKSQSQEAERYNRDALEGFRSVLGDGHVMTIQRSMTAALLLLSRSRYDEARVRLEKLLATARKSFGENAKEVGDCLSYLGLIYRNLGRLDDAAASFERAIGVFSEASGPTDSDTLLACIGLAEVYGAQGRHTKAEALQRQTLKLLVQTEGDRSQLALTLRINLAANLTRQGRPEAALPLAQKALETVRVLPDKGDRRHLALLNVLGTILQKLGRMDEAQAMLRECLTLCQKTLGEDQADTAYAYNALGALLFDLERHAEAREMHARALAIRRRILPAYHPDTVISYYNLALCLDGQGKYAEAQVLLEKGLAISTKVDGEDSLPTAMGSCILAGNLRSQGQPARALRLLQKVLAIYQTTPPSPVRLAACYRELASTLDQLGEYEKAAEWHEKALAIFRKSVGESHPDTTACENNLGHNLALRGKHEESLALSRRVYASRRKTLGEDHPLLAAVTANLAGCLWQLGRRNEAVRLLQASLPAQEAARHHQAATGFDRAQLRDYKAYPILTVGLAGLNQPRNAFAAAELNLARGLLDDLAAPAGDTAEVRSLQAQLADLSRRLLPLAGRAGLSDEQIRRRDELMARQRETASRLVRVLSAASQRQVLPLERIQKAIPADGALVFWIDVWGISERWGCVVRREGDPRWVRIVGSGTKGAWLEEDETVRTRLYDALRDPTSTAKKRKELLAAFARQRLGPLRPHLKAAGELPAVKRLFVVPTGAMAHVPVELLDENLSVSYVPSGSVLARLVENHRKLEASSLLVLGDPAFDQAEPPSEGVMIGAVTPGGNADKAGLKPGDVLLSVGGVKIESADDLPAALKRLPAEATFWHAGKTSKVELKSPPGAAFDRRAPRAALRALRRDSETTRGTGHKRLPGTRVEAEALAALVKGSIKLVGSAASEQRLDELIEKGELKKYRILHFATHGQVNHTTPDRTALILAQDDLPNPLDQARLGRHVYDGCLTVARIRERWKLDADLVVLSACETGLGKQAGGDGLLGFTQAFLSRGARAVVVSRWPVHDAVTSLLMRRFYQNLLGKRDGLTQPLGRAAALAEAKDWLRNLSSTQLEDEVKSLPPGDRGKSVPAPSGKAKACEHPYYWAAFTLVGDPD
jgi:tetratricopeptide (TPR) repeat protein